MISIGLAALAAVACSEQAVTSPAVAACAPPFDLGMARGIDNPLAASVAAVEDARQRILPAFRADSALGELQATAILAAALEDLAAELAGSRSPVERSVREATQALRSLSDAVAGDAGRAADVTAVRLAVEEACAVGT